MAKLNIIQICLSVALCVSVNCVQRLIDKPPECGASLGCYHDCKKDGCDFLVTWYYIEEFDAIQFSMSKVVSNQYDNVWLAMGLSYDRLMGDDSVLECSTDWGLYWLAGARQSYNEQYYNVDIYNAYFGMREIKGRQQDGVLQCNFTRIVHTTGGDRIYDLDRPWYLLVAYGDIKEGIKHQHARREDFPFISTSKVDLREHTDVSVKAVSYIAKIHGSLMIFAWVILASISVVVARLFKQPWYTHSGAYGNKWHLTHKSLMVCVVIFTLSSFVLIWTSTGGYSKLKGRTIIQRAHPVLGVFIMGLTFLNPMVALLRPSKASTSQSMYKYAHSFVGAVVFVLAVLNIMLGVTLPVPAVPTYLLWLLVGFAGYQVLIHTVLELCDCFLIRSGKLVAFEATKNSRDVKSDPQKNPPGMVPKLILLSLHVVVSIGVGVTSILFITLYSGEGAFLSH